MRPSHKDPSIMNSHELKAAIKHAKFWIPIEKTDIRNEFLWEAAYMANKKWGVCRISEIDSKTKVAILEWELNRKYKIMFHNSEKEAIGVAEAKNELNLNEKLQKMHIDSLNDLETKLKQYENALNNLTGEN